MKAYLDIETDRNGNICVIGIHTEPSGFVQWHGENINTGDIEKELQMASTIVTFNGDSFDLPTIKKYLNIDLKEMCSSRDLFKVKKRLGIKGGLKELEKMFGIKRKTEGINGYKAVLLWERYIRRKKPSDLSLLLEYNKEDVLNLIPLEEKLDELKGEML
ncbi:MAG: ribonuclease H-like domain-containing protein [Syntrophobacterales bacterium]|nr:ribonuclease H-like domain-containing protein [Syntrophobacterales bacterium]